MAQDNVCLTDDTSSASCANSFGFFAIESETGLNNIDGILGLSPAEGDNGPSYVEALKTSGSIDEEIISFSLAASPNASSI